MKKEIVIKRIIQGAALCMGVMGVIWVYLGLHFLFTGISGKDLFGILLMSPLFLSFGIVFILIAVQNLRSFGADSIKSVLFVICFMLYGTISRSLFQYRYIGWPVEAKILAPLLPLLLVCLLYSLISRKLIRMTGYEEKTPDKAALEKLINRLDISDVSKKSITNLMMWRKASKTIGYLFIAAGWFLLLLWIFSSVGMGFLISSNPDFFRENTRVMGGIGFLLFVGYAVGRVGQARLEKITLSKAFIEMMNSNPKLPPEA